MFRVYTDPGHGWIAVKRELLVELGILEKITPFSYQKGQTVYLEEDCDATTFITAYEKRFGKKPAFAESTYHTNSPIRRYEGFKP